MTVKLTITHKREKLTKADKDYHQQYMKLMRAYKSEYEGKFSYASDAHREAAWKVIDKREEKRNLPPVPQSGLKITDIAIEVDQQKEDKQVYDRRMEKAQKVSEKYPLLVDVFSKFENQENMKNRKAAINVLYKRTVNENGLQRDTSVKWLENTKKVIDDISQYAENGRVNRFAAVAKILTLSSGIKKLTPKLRQTHIDVVREMTRLQQISYARKFEGLTVNDKLVSDLISPKSKVEKQQWFEYDDLLNEFFQDGDKLSEDVMQVILALYLYLPTGRTEYKTLKLIGENDTQNYNDNYLVIDNNKVPKEIVVNDFKTKNKYISLSRDLSDRPELSAILEDYINNESLNFGDYLFNGKERKNFHNLFQQSFLELVGKKITPKVMRKIYISNLWKEPRTAEQIVADSMDVLHSLQVEISQYVKK